jgi:TolB-like protein/DNA-binding winged helix-turn-helix (wHTH) protein/tetratricopeptide (TPR) repeat protein
LIMVAMVAEMLKSVDERWQVADLTIDTGGQTVRRDGVPIHLPQLSFRFLLALVRAAPRLLSTDDLMEQVWVGVFVNGETVTQRAKLLRDALSDNPRSPRYFKVRRGAGYQLVPVPVRLDQEEDRLTGPTSPRRRAALLSAVMLGVALAVGPSSIPVSLRPSHAAQGASPRVAVLPFDNLSRDASDAFIARSIPEMVLDRLSSVRGLTVIARDSALLSPAAMAPTREAAQELRADFIVKGSVQRVGETLRVTCFVEDTRQHARIWSERFDWPVGRIYALQDRIAESVATSLNQRSRTVGVLPGRARTARDSDAYLAYLKGKSLLSRFTVAETDAAAAQFERAVALDPGFPDALVALFDAKMQGALLRGDDLAPFRARYWPLLDKAMRIDPDTGPALFAKAMWSEQPFEARLQLFRRATRLDPSNSRGLTAYGEFLDKLGSDAVRGTGGYEREAEQLIERVLAIDPLSPRARWWSVQRRWTSIPPQELEQEMAGELATDPLNYSLVLFYARSRWYLHGDTAGAIERIEQVIANDPQQPTGPNTAIALYLDADDPAAAGAIAASTPATRASSRILLAQFKGDWRTAGAAALSETRFPFNLYQTWNWPQAVRDYALQTGQYDRAAKAIAARYGFELANPRTMGPPQVISAPALAQILMLRGERAKASRLLAQTVQWIDTHPDYGMAFHMRARAEAMMLLGERDEALSNLQAAFETGHDVRHWWYVVDREPIWAPVRADPRFEAIAERLRQAARVERAKLDHLRQAGKAPVRPRSA